MYSHQISDMAKKLTEALEKRWSGTGPPLTEDVITNVLVAYWYDKLAVTWTIEDVKWLAKERTLARKLSDFEAKEILEQLKRDYDASTGINWDIIEEAIRNYCHAEGITYK